MFDLVNILYKNIETFSSQAYVNLNDKNDVKKMTFWVSLRRIVNGLFKL